MSNGPCMGNELKDPMTFNTDQPLQPNGSQDLINKGTAFRNDIVFFNASDQYGRPIKKLGFRRPKSKAQRHGRISSPASEERPRKRPRDCGVFKFDLNTDPRDKTNCSEPNIGMDEIMEIRQESSDEDNREQAGIGDGFTPVDVQPDAEAIQTIEEDAEIIADTFDGQFSDEI
ncbi:hypothetical protein Hanom_Chr15g01378031 [Helianthus anomalus]